MWRPNQGKSFLLSGMLEPRGFDSNGPDAQKVLTQFQTALHQDDARILEKSAEHPELRGMGTR